MKKFFMKFFSLYPLRKGIAAIIFLSSFIIPGCSKLDGTRSDPKTACGAFDCHNSSSLKNYYPVNDQGHRNHIERLKLECFDCHYSYDGNSNHKNTKIDNRGDDTLIVFFDPGVNGNGSFDRSTASCSGLSCHGDTSWINPVFPGCTDMCHKPGNRYTAEKPISPDPNESGSHAAHALKMTGAICEECHEGYLSSPAHRDGKLDTAMTAPSMITFNPSRNPAGVYAPGTRECSATYCHGNFSGGNGAAVFWSGSAPCGSCHPAGPTSPVSVKHTAHLSRYPDQCGYCHRGYTKNSASTNHVDFSKTVDFGYPHPSGTEGLPSYNRTSKTCINVYCHGNFPKVLYNGTAINTGNGFSPVWLDASTSACGSCHGKVSNNYSSATHGKHTATNQVYFNNTSSIESCDSCHNYGADSMRTFGTDSTQGSYNTSKHADFSIYSAGVNTDVKFKDDNLDLAAKMGDIVSAKTAWDPVLLSCNNSWCHGNFSGTLIGKNATPKWLDPSTALCDSCHTATPPSTNSHPKHISTPYRYGCQKCHGGYVGHVDGSIGGADSSVGFDGTNPYGTFEPGTKKCANLYCHGNTTGGDWGNFTYPLSAKNNDPVWSATGSVTCGTCHDAVPGTLVSGSHGKHIAGTTGNYGYPCRRCHADTYSGDTSSLSAGHADGILEVKPDVNNSSGNYSRAGAGRTCAGFYCHGNFTGGNSANVPDWKIPSTGTCGTCHGVPPLKSNYGAHDKHTTSSSYNYSCQHCHNGYATGNELTAAYASTSTHADFTKNVSFNTLADQGPRTAATYDSLAGTCSYTYCHGDFISVSGTQGNAGNTPSGAV